MPDYTDAYAGTSGLRDDFVGTLKDHIFTTDSEYQNGQALIARLEFEADDGEEIVLKLSTGKDWEDDAKGTKAKRIDGADPGKGFNKSCNYFLFCDGALQTDYRDHMVKTAPPWDMKLWDGEPMFHISVIELPAVEKGAEPRRVRVPVEFLGFADGKKPAKGKAASKADAADEEAETPAQRAKRLAAEKKAAKAAPVEEDDADTALLKTIASEADTHEEFMERAYGELEDAAALEDTIIDEDWYTANH